MAIEQLSEIDVTQERALRMSLLAEANRSAPQTLLWFDAIDNRLNVSRGAQVENDRHQLSVPDALLTRGWIIEADGQPDCLAMMNVLAWAQMLIDNF